MTKIRLAAFAAAIAAAAMSIGSAGASSGTSAQTVDLSTDQAVVSYLTSLGIDPTGVVIQRGALNYAGPNCPGTGWACTTSTKVVQVAQPGGQNVVSCGAGADVVPDSYLTTTLTQDQIDQVVTAASSALPINTCVAVQGGAAQTNTARCVKRDTTELPAPTQDCHIVQPATDGSNRAFVLERIDQSVGPMQNGTQRSNIAQTALGGATNFLHVIQYVTQSTSADGAQTQQESQLACSLQTSVSGNQFAQTIQSVAQKEQTKATTNQSQNADPGTEACDDDAAATGGFTTSTANTFARVEQNSTNGGDLESHVNQSHNLDARGTAGIQTQGSAALDGGIQGKVFQNSSGVARSFGVQNEDQNLSGNSPTITQNQFGPLLCCSTQTGGNPGDDVQIDLMSAQRAITSTSPLNDLVPAIPNPDAHQETLLIGTFETSGDGDITNKAKQNEGSSMSSCPPGEQSEGGTTTCVLITYGLNGVFVPTCPDDEFFNPETGKCESVDID
jgi:hypothetical protein